MIPFSFKLARLSFLSYRVSWESCQSHFHLVRPDFFLLVDLWDLFFRFRVRGGGSSENDQLTGHFQSCFFVFVLFCFVFHFQIFLIFFLVSPEKTV